MNNPDKIMLSCATCGQQFQFGRNIYDGKFIPIYNITVCRTCYNSNHDGWAPHYERKILMHIKEEGISEPKRNKDGLLPRE